MRRLLSSLSSSPKTEPTAITNTNASSESRDSPQTSICPIILGLPHDETPQFSNLSNIPTQSHKALPVSGSSLEHDVITIELDSDLSHRHDCKGASVRLGPSFTPNRLACYYAASGEADNYDGFPSGQNPARGFSGGGLAIDHREPRCDRISRPHDPRQSSNFESDDRLDTSCESSSGSSSCDSLSNASTDNFELETLYHIQKNQDELFQVRQESLRLSKHLTFGRIFFSDVLHEPTSKDRGLRLGPKTVAVIDGLGDEWSFYAAEHYPGSTIHNLSPRYPLPESHEAHRVHENHRQHRYVSHLGRFPILSESLTTVVYRFPTVASESEHRNIITEAGRVLQRGGGLEVLMLADKRRRAEMASGYTATNAFGSNVDVVLSLILKTGFQDIRFKLLKIPEAGSNACSSKVNVRHWWYSQCFNEFAVSSAECEALELFVCCAKTPGRW